MSPLQGYEAGTRHLQGHKVGTRPLQGVQGRYTIPTMSTRQA